MKKNIFKVSIAFPVLLLLLCTQVLAEKNSQKESWKEFEKFVEQSMKQWKVPGLSLAVVSGEDVIYTLGFGLRDVKNNLPVTPETVFAIGSSTKAFTATLVGILVGEGKIDWDTPVIQYLPCFKLKDRYATERITPRDLLCHRSGLPDHTLAWYCWPSSRKETLDHLQYLEPAADFRTEFHYNNFMITTAGYLAGQVSGSTWETLVQKRIFQPLDMRNSDFTCSITDPRAENNFAIPYSFKNGMIQEIPLSRAYEAVGPAGNIISNAKDMANWLKLHLNKGVFHGKHIISEAALKETHFPHITNAGVGFEDDDSIMYGLGWFIDYFRGKMRIQHGGAFEGYFAFVSFIPEDRIGIVVLANMHLTLLPMIIANTLFDRLLGTERTDWNEWLQKRMKQAAESAAQAAEAQKIVQKAGTGPAHLLNEYTGKYYHPGYGTLEVRLEKDTLKASLNGAVSFDLKHFHYELFNTENVSAPALEYAREFFLIAKFLFVTDVRGDVNQIVFKMNYEGVSDVVFTRRAE